MSTLLDIDNDHNQSIHEKFFDKSLNLSIQPKTLQELITLLHQAFSTDHVNIDYIHAIMKNYQGNVKEWLPYIKFHPNKYTRNLVDAGNGKFNLMILCWAEGQGSSIHDHTNSHCFMKCLQGCLMETKYAWPKQLTNHNQNQTMEIITRTELKSGQVAYINDSIGLHRVENPSHTEKAVTLHLYVPPYDHCRVFDERTSRVSGINVNFYSIEGQIITKD